MAPKEYPRKLRLNSQLQRELTEMIRDLRDPRVSGVTVTAADVSPDMRQAKILVSRLPPEASAEEAVAALNKAGGRLRRELGHRLHVHHIPELHFAVDQVPAAADKLSRLIRDARAKDRQHAADRGEPES